MIPCLNRGWEKPMNKKMHKQIYHRIVPGLSRDYPGTVPAFFSDFLGNGVHVCPLSAKKKATHKQA